MSGGPELPAGASGARDPGEDTIELLLTDAQQLELSQAANAAARPSEAPPRELGHDTFVCRRSERVDFVCTLTFVVLVLGVTAASGWHALVVHPSPPTPVVAVAIAAPVATAPTPEAQPPGPLVQVINPFDATEVFEFPAGTSESEARDSIADLLLQRARERHQQGLDLRRAGHRHHPPAIATDNQADIFVTRLSGAAPTYLAVTR